jgi:hypothetical protein
MKEVLAVVAVMAENGSGSGGDNGVINDSHSDP